MERKLITRRQVLLGLGLLSAGVVGTSFGVSHVTAQSSDEDCVISGRVILSGGQEPRNLQADDDDDEEFGLSNVRIIATGENPQRRTVSVVTRTDRYGYFCFTREELPRGRYFIRAVRQGYRIGPNPYPREIAIPGGAEDVNFVARRQGGELPR